MGDVKRLILAPPRKGACPVCAVRHDDRQPHNPNSLYYRTRFYQENGRYPTWADAMAHCAPDVRAVWRTELLKLGVDVDGEEADDGRMD